MELNKLTIEEYSSLLEAKKSVPGGGSALALVLELACDLGLMTCNFTVDKKGYEEVRDEVISITHQLQDIKKKAHELINLDGEAYNAVMSAFKTGDAKLIAEASLYACEIPYELYTQTSLAENLCKRMVEIGNKNLISDAEAGRVLCQAIYPGCIGNIKCNINAIDETKKEKFLSLLK